MPKLTWKAAALFVCAHLALFAAEARGQQGPEFASGTPGAAWFEAAQHGNASAQCMVGYMLSIGLETPINVPAAHQWFHKAAKQGDTESMIRLIISQMENYGDFYFEPEDTARWAEQLASAGDVRAQLCYGRYLSAHGRATNGFARSRYWLGCAVKQGSSQAMVDLGSSLIHGFKGTAPDLPAGLLLFERAAGMGNCNACYYLGLLHERGWGVLVNLPLAVIWYREGAARGSGLAWGALGSLWEEGLDGPPDQQRAIWAYENAAIALKGNDQTNKVLRNEALHRVKLLREKAHLPPWSWVPPRFWVSPQLLLPPTWGSTSR